MAALSHLLLATLKALDVGRLEERHAIDCAGHCDRPSIHEHRSFCSRDVDEGPVPKEVPKSVEGRRKPAQLTGPAKEAARGAGGL